MFYNKHPERKVGNQTASVLSQRLDKPRARNYRRTMNFGFLVQIWLTWCRHKRGGPLKSRAHSGSRCIQNIYSGGRFETTSLNYLKQHSVGTSPQYVETSTTGFSFCTRESVQADTAWSETPKGLAQMTSALALDYNNDNHFLSTEVKRDIQFSWNQFATY